MELTSKKIRVVHFPQVGSLKKAFHVEVKDEHEAYKIMTVLANQHLWLYKNKIIPDYSNAIFVETYDTDIDEETNKPYGWANYHNEKEEMEWDEFEENYLQKPETA